MKDPHGHQGKERKKEALHNERESSDVEEREKIIGRKKRDK